MTSDGRPASEVGPSSEEAKEGPLSSLSPLSPLLATDRGRRPFLRKFRGREERASERPDDEGEVRGGGGGGRL